MLKGPVKGQVEGESGHLLASTRTLSVPRPVGARETFDTRGRCGDLTRREENEVVATSNWQRASVEARWGRPGVLELGGNFGKTTIPSGVLGVVGDGGDSHSGEQSLTGPRVRHRRKEDQSRVRPEKVGTASFRGVEEGGRANHAGAPSKRDLPVCWLSGEGPLFLPELGG